MGSYSRGEVPIDNNDISSWAMDALLNSVGISWWIWKAPSRDFLIRIYPSRPEQSKPLPVASCSLGMPVSRENISAICFPLAIEGLKMLNLYFRLLVPLLVAALFALGICQILQLRMTV